MNAPIDGFINPFIFSSDKTDVQNMATAAKYLRVRQDGGQALTEWMHDVAKRFNDPEMCVLAADKYKGWAESTVLTLRLTALKDNLLEWEPDEKLFALTGNGAFANTFKRIESAMRLGADLVNSETTVSLCQKFVTNYNKQMKQGNEAQMRRDQLGRLAERAGHTPGSQEYNQYVENGMAISRPAAVGTRHPGEENTSEPKDVFAQAADVIAEKLREIAKYNATTANEQITAITGKLDKVIQGVVADFAQKALAKAQKDSQQQSAA